MGVPACQRNSEAYSGVSAESQVKARGPEPLVCSHGVSERHPSLPTTYCLANRIHIFQYSKPNLEPFTGRLEADQGFLSS